MERNVIVNRKSLLNVGYVSNPSVADIPDFAWQQLVDYLCLKYNSFNSDIAFLYGVIKFRVRNERLVAEVHVETRMKDGAAKTVDKYFDEKGDLGPDVDQEVSKWWKSNIQVYFEDQLSESL